MNDDDRMQDATQDSGAAMPAPESPMQETGPRVTDKRRVHDPFTGEDETAQEQSGELEAARAQAAVYLDDLRRLKAEFENFRKRVVKEQTALIDTASASLVEDLLPILDDFELALIAADRSKDYESLVRGVDLVFSKFRELLTKRGLRKIDAEGKPFDPELHEAVMEETGDEEGKPVVIEVFRNGYTIAGRVVRPAMVKVRKGS